MLARFTILFSYLCFATNIAVGMVTNDDAPQDAQAAATKKIVFSELIANMRSLIECTCHENTDENKKSIDLAVQKNLSFWHKFKRGMNEEATPEDFELFFGIYYALVNEATDKYTKTGKIDFLRMLTSYNMELLKELGNL